MSLQSEIKKVIGSDVIVTFAGGMFHGQIYARSPDNSRMVVRVMLDINRYGYMVIARPVDHGDEPLVVVPPVNFEAAHAIARDVIFDHNLPPQEHLPAILNYLATAVIALYGERQ